MGPSSCAFEPQVISRIAFSLCSREVQLPLLSGIPKEGMGLPISGRGKEPGCYLQICPVCNAQPKVTYC